MSTVEDRNLSDREAYCNIELELPVFMFFQTFTCEDNLPQAIFVIRDKSGDYFLVEEEVRLYVVVEMFFVVGVRTWLFVMLKKG